MEALKDQGNYDEAIVAYKNPYTLNLIRLSYSNIEVCQNQGKYSEALENKQSILLILI